MNRKSFLQSILAIPALGLLASKAATANISKPDLEVTAPVEPESASLPYIPVFTDNGKFIGKGREPFQFVLTTREYKVGDTLTYDFQDGIQVQVIDVDPVYNTPNWAMYTVQLKSTNPQNFINHRWLNTGVEWVKISTVGEYYPMS